MLSAARPCADPEQSAWGLIADDAASARGGSRGPGSDGSPQLELDDARAAAVGAKRPRVAAGWGAGAGGAGGRGGAAGGSPGRLDGLVHVAQHELAAAAAATADQRCAAPPRGGGRGRAPGARAGGCC